MQTITFAVADEEQYNQLLSLAHKMSISTINEQRVLTEAERQYHLAIIVKGGSGKSIPDPVAWQREVRQDRPLPGRD